ncbi:hypothetical protein [Agrobacterium sp. B1(2019)]|uniref:hypothetical protein n=1 Tax=Agrobacterium sp. B1(2019) TaxID=2607032 RepID=UPI0011ECBD03|nr:hypothetical protein [Agrobacterium sp. B1(2019)]TZG36621.1 hypothetical protein AGR1_03745 [Agrobacterium sp. B1(2019)]
MNTKPKKTTKTTKAEKLAQQDAARQAHFREIEGQMSNLLSALYDEIGSRRKKPSANARDK